MALLENIYTLALKHPCCLQATATVLRAIPFGEKNYFKAFRHIFKISEFRLDPLIFGIVALRVETSSAGGRGEPFGIETKNYLRRRSWRALRRLGEAGDPAYVRMAAGMLFAVSDEHTQAPRNVGRSEWIWTAREERVVSTTYFDSFSHFLALNHILHQNSSQYRLLNSRKAWYRADETADTGRVEAFPGLWDEQPEAALGLLFESRAGIVHRFAVRVLRDNPTFCKEIPVEDIARLLCAAYPETGEFALDLARQLYDPENPDFALLTACLSATFEPAREQAVQWISSQPELLRRFPELLAQIIVSPFEDIRSRSKEFMAGTQLSEIERAALVEQVIGLVRDMGEGGRTEGFAEICSFLEEHFEPELRRTDLQTVRGLLESDAVEVQIFGARLLLISDISAEAIPGEMLAMINRSPSEELQGIGVSLLAKYGDDQLLARRELLFSYCLSEIAPVRAAVRPIIERVADLDAGFAAHFFDNLIAELFKKERCEGLHADIIRLVETALRGPLKAVDKNLRWRLIHARSKAAQQMGAISLEDAAGEDYTVRQWAAFADSPVVSVRRWAMAAYEADADRVRKHAGDALRILNSRWDDSRSFGIDYFGRTFTKADWNPSIIIGICDSTREDVQRFGRELITEFFEEGDGVEYMMKLSQHPSRNVQLFTTNYLKAYAGGDIRKLEQLEPYFITVLSNVCKGRVAKDRVTLFLLSEALESEAAANFVAAIFNRQSVTYALTDKAAYIECMCDIREKYPDVPLEIRAVPLPIKGIGESEAADGV